MLWIESTELKKQVFAKWESLPFSVAVLVCATLSPMSRVALIIIFTAMVITAVYLITNPR